MSEKTKFRGSGRMAWVRVLAITGDACTPEMSLFCMDMELCCAMEVAKYRASKSQATAFVFSHGERVELAMYEPGLSERKILSRLKEKPIPLAYANPRNGTGCRRCGTWKQS